MENEKISVKDMLKITVEEIEKITVPVKYADQISRPLCQAVYNLRTCISAMETEKNPEVGENVQC